MEIVPAEGLPDDELAVYTLTHGGKSMRFFMETFGEPDENGRFPLYIVLHGSGDASAEFNNNA